MNQQKLSKSEFSEQADVIARRIVTALEGEQEAFLVLEALCRVHRFVCVQIPTKSLGAAGFALGAYAGELMQASATGKGLGTNNPIH
ncbi:hypothetical protein [Acidovorax sp. NCPPB 3576]|uniref:hypothetical protein n=1 Tax=Acidovorax sp. NCPPB 3576 TaxID=2940488 RepID=UPI00234B7F6E|nr:hypothetical protein [Acidovorax sp. NCPPB 3576]WCM88538.1 hypothetical protein M5C98_00280 [Acidovorax sp. NCPPB 3576]